MVTQDTETTAVVFRRWRGEPHTVIALFPDIQNGDPQDTNNVLSYEHIGQHGGADYSGVIRRTVRATPREYRDLKAELEGLGYNLKVKLTRYAGN